MNVRKSFFVLIFFALSQFAYSDESLWFTADNVERMFYITIDSANYPTAASVIGPDNVRQYFYSVDNTLKNKQKEYSQFRAAVALYSANTEVTDFNRLPRTHLFYGIVVTHNDGSKVKLLVDISKAFSTGNVINGFSITRAIDGSSNPIALDDNSLSLMHDNQYLGEVNVNALNRLLQTYDNVTLHNFCSTEAARMSCQGKIDERDRELYYSLTCMAYSQGMCGG